MSSHIGDGNKFNVPVDRSFLRKSVSNNQLFLVDIQKQVVAAAVPASRSEGEAASSSGRKPSTIGVSNPLLTEANTRFLEEGQLDANNAHTSRIAASISKEVKAIFGENKISEDEEHFPDFIETLKKERSQLLENENLSDENLNRGDAINRTITFLRGQRVDELTNEDLTLIKGEFNKYLINCMKQKKEIPDNLIKLYELIGPSDKIIKELREMNHAIRLESLAQEYSTPVERLDVSDVTPIDKFQGDPPQITQMHAFGATKSGQTALNVRLCDDCYREKSIDKDFYNPLQYKVGEEDVEAKLLIHDVPDTDTERFRKILNTTSPNTSKGILLTLDLSKSSGAEDAKQVFEEKIKSKYAIKGSTPVIVVATKLDLADEERLQKAKQFADERGLKICFVSSKENVGFDVLRTHLAQRDHEVKHPKEEEQPRKKMEQPRVPIITSENKKTEKEWYRFW